MLHDRYSEAALLLAIVVVFVHGAIALLDWQGVKTDPVLADAAHGALAGLLLALGARTASNGGLGK